MARVSITDRALELVSAFEKHGYGVKAVEIDKTKIRIEFATDQETYSELDRLMGLDKN
jgi:hypothetical protein